MAISRRERMLKTVCSVCHQAYTVPAATLKHARRTGDHWLCSAGHPQFPSVPAANAKIRALLDRKLAERHDSDQRLAALEARNERLKHKNRDLLRIQKALTSRVSSLLVELAEDRAPTSEKLRECEKQERAAEHHAEALELKLKEARVSAVAERQRAIESAHEAEASLVFDELELGNCPKLGCSYKFGTLEDLLEHARLVHRTEKADGRRAGRADRLTKGYRQRRSGRHGTAMV